MLLTTKCKFTVNHLRTITTADLSYQVVGGAVGMGFALYEAIDSWTDLIKNNHVTEASQSLRDTADDIRKICEALKKLFSEMRYGGGHIKPNVSDTEKKPDYYLLHYP